MLATVVLLWDVAKWFKSGPKIRERIQLDSYYPDSKVLKVEKSDNGETKELAAYCHIELVNTGSLPTTIMGISASHIEASKNGKVSVTNQSFIPHYGKNIPHVLPPGEVWSCRLEMTNLCRLIERGKPYLEVYVSHKQKPIIIWPKLDVLMKSCNDTES